MDVTVIQLVSGSMQESSHLMAKKSGVKRLQLQNSNFKAKVKENVVHKEIQMQRENDPTCYNLHISEIFCMLRVKMKPITYNVSCCPSLDLRTQP